MTTRYGIAEWYGNSLLELTPVARQRLAKVATKEDDAMPPCPFQSGTPPCRKPGGVCSIRRYKEHDGRLGSPEGEPVIVCPARFEERQLLIHWLAEIVGFEPHETKIAREVPFMRGTDTGKAAGKIDLVIARESATRIEWYGLEIQAVYFSGQGMQSEFDSMRMDDHPKPPYPQAVRRPDWRSSSAKRLMPQLQIKVPTLRRWGSKMAIAVDRPFFESVGGHKTNPNHDLNDGDVIWLVPELICNAEGNYELSRGYWEVLTLEDTNAKLLAAKTIQRDAFEQGLRDKLYALD